MHQLVLLTALSATSGLFGGGKHCDGGRAMVAPAQSSCSSRATAPAYSYATAPAPAYGAPAYAPMAPAPTYAAPAPQAAPQVQAMSPAPVSMTSYYYAPGGCAGGNCSVR